MEVEHHLKPKPLHPFTCCFNGDTVTWACNNKYSLLIGNCVVLCEGLVTWTAAHQLCTIRSNWAAAWLRNRMSPSQSHTSPLSSSCYVKPAVFYHARTHAQIHPPSQPARWHTRNQLGKTVWISTSARSMKRLHPACACTRCPSSVALVLPQTLDITGTCWWFRSEFFPKEV